MLASRNGNRYCSKKYQTCVEKRKRPDPAGVFAVDISKNQENLAVEEDNHSFIPGANLGIDSNVVLDTIQETRA